MKVGDKVVCINDNKRDYTTKVKKGNIYTITHMRLHPVYKEMGVKLKEVLTNENSNGYFNAERFRKVQPKRSNAATRELCEQLVEERLEPQRVKI